MYLWCGTFEENLAFCLRFLLGAQGDFSEAPEGLRYRSGLLFPAYNGVLYRSHRVEAEGFLERELEDFRIKKVPFLFSVATSYELPPSSLRSMGLSRVGAVPAMVRGLSEEIQMPALADWQIERVTDEASLAAWVSVQCRGFAFPRWLEQEVFALLRGVSLDKEVALFLGRWRGEPVATSMSVHQGDVVGIYNVSVLPQARRRGFGEAMTAYALENGRKAGARSGILQATPEGEALYRKMGFVPVGQFEHYMWASWSQWLRLIVGGLARAGRARWQQWRARS
ncbi:MAG: GNAT family N-acetyltransferase [Myxococcales bacterium]|nr:GNAT family N-acetyltransferase [Myxococcales bacterium]